MAGPKTLGIIEGIAEATSSIFKLVSGVIVDRTKKTKPWIVIGYLLAGIGRAAKQANEIKIPVRGITNQYLKPRKR